MTGVNSTQAKRSPFDSKGKFMREIVTTTNAIDKVISIECGPNTSKAKRGEVTAEQLAMNDALSSRRVKTAERTIRPVKLGTLVSDSGKRKPILTNTVKTATTSAAQS